MYIIPNEDYNYQYTIVVNYVTHDSFGKATIIHGFIFRSRHCMDGAISFQVFLDTINTFKIPNIPFLSL